MKILYILAVVVSILFVLMDLYYIQKYEQEELEYDYDMFRAPEDAVFSDSGREGMHSVTREGALVSAVFIVFYLLTFSFTLTKLRSRTAKVLSIIGLSASAICLCWCFLPVTTPGHVDFGEFGPGMFAYIILMLVFCITNLYQAIAYIARRNPNQDTVDDLI